MKHEMAKLNTKKALSAALKKLMKEKTFSRITITEITAESNLNRKTFYYHFSDINELVKWTIEQDAIETVKAYSNLNNYQDAIKFTVDYVEENKHLLQSIYNSVGRDEMRCFFSDDFKDIIKETIVRKQESINIRTDEDFIEFMCNFYIEAITGLIVENFSNDKATDKKKLRDYVSIAISSSIPAILQSAGKKYAATDAGVKE